MRIHKVMPEVEAFDLSHIINAIDMYSKGLLFGDLYVQFVMGVKNAMPADKTISANYYWQCAYLGTLI